MVDKLPSNLRLSKLTNYEKSFISYGLLFWASIEYLGTFEDMQKDTHEIFMNQNLDILNIKESMILLAFGKAFFSSSSFFF
jgi:hypothetical protein